MLPPASAVAGLGHFDYVTRGTHKHSIVGPTVFANAVESVFVRITPRAVPDAACEVAS